MRVQRGQPCGELAAVHARHDDVGDEEIEVGRRSLREPERESRIARLDDRVAERAEGPRRDRADRGLVLDEEDRPCLLYTSDAADE